ncbi:MAG: magnesium transporter [Clostridia bacterium]|nr:magnesium transporter [Clostridia bacterium]
MEQRNDLNEELQTHPDYAAEIAELIRSDISAAEKKERLADYHANDIADAWTLLSDKERKNLVALLDQDQTAEIFSYLEDPEEYLSELGDDKAADILESMDADDAVDVLESLEPDQQEKLIELMEKDARQDIELIQSYDEDQIGSKMTTNFISVSKDLTIKQAMHTLIEQAAENDNISTIYVLNKDGTFHGAIDLPDLIRARDYEELESLVTTSYPYVFADENVDQCIEQLKDYSEDSIPVLDHQMKLLGVITSQDLVEVVDEELGDDYAKLGGLTEEEDLDEPLHQSLRKRIPWLVVLMFLGLAVSAVVSLYEPVMAQLTLVVAFQSMILDMSGNVGTQSLAVTIRVLSDEQLTAKQKLHLVFKEGRVGFVGGMLLGIASTIVIGIYVHFCLTKDWLFSFAVSGCIGLSLMVAMGISALVGTVTPLFFKKIKVDPAVASGPLITTVNDFVAVITYYTLVEVLLINCLHLAG